MVYTLQVKGKRVGTLFTNGLKEFHFVLDDYRHETKCFSFYCEANASIRTAIRLFRDRLHMTDEVEAVGIRSIASRVDIKMVNDALDAHTQT